MALLSSFALLLVNVENAGVFSLSMISRSSGLFASSSGVDALVCSARPSGMVEMASDVAPGGEVKHILDVHGIHSFCAGLF